MRRRALVLGVPLCALPVPRAPTQRLLDLFSAPALAASLGRAYLAGLPAAPAADALAVAVLAALPGTGRLRAEVAALIRRDYAANRIACVDGWLLSITEARLCAMAALAEI